jgi:D-xylose transport system substrate-binding protein
MNSKIVKLLASATLVGSGAAALVPGVSGASGGVSAKSFTPSYSAMFGLQKIAAMAKSGIGVILPDEVSSNRYVEFDAPNITQALTDAGLSTSQINVQNAQGSPATEISIAQADIAQKDKVLIMDPLDSTTGKTIEAMAKKAGVQVIDYDRLTVGGSAKYYVSFNNVTVGQLIGKGALSCIAAWHVKNPLLYVMNGSTTTDNNAVLFAQGYDAVLNKAGYKAGVGAMGNAKTINETGTGTWTPSQALTDFQGAFSKNGKINAVVTPNDENAAPIISFLQGQGLKPKSIPFTGQDATLTGFQNIISGYQCGTVYKPIWQEAQAAAALALYLRAGKTPPASLVNGHTMDKVAHRSVASVLLTPTWVTAANIEKTVVANGVISPVALCTSFRPAVKGFKAPTYAQDCKTYGIK